MNCSDCPTSAVEERDGESVVVDARSPAKAACHRFVVVERLCPQAALAMVSMRNGRRRAQPLERRAVEWHDRDRLLDQHDGDSGSSDLRFRDQRSFRVAKEALGERDVWVSGLSEVAGAEAMVRRIPPAAQPSAGGRTEEQRITTERMHPDQLIPWLENMK